MSGRGGGRGADWKPSPASGIEAHGTRPPFEPGNLAALRHGASSPRMLEPLAQQIEEELRASAPWTARPAFGGAVKALAWSEAEVTLRRAWADEHGLVAEDGTPLPGTDRLERAEARAAKLRDQLGLTPRSYASLIATVASALGPGDDEVLEALTAEGRRILEARRAALPDADEHLEDGAS